MSRFYDELSLIDSKAIKVVKLKALSIQFLTELNNLAKSEKFSTIISSPILASTPQLLLKCTFYEQDFIINPEFKIEENGTNMNGFLNTYFQEYSKGMAHKILSPILIYTESFDIHGNINNMFSRSDFAPHYLLGLIKAFEKHASKTSEYLLISSLIAG